MNDKEREAMHEYSQELKEFNDALEVKLSKGASLLFYLKSARNNLFAGDIEVNEDGVKVMKSRKEIAEELKAKAKDLL